MSKWEILFSEAKKGGSDMYKYNLKKEWLDRRQGIGKSKTGQGDNAMWKARVVQERSELHSRFLAESFAGAILGKTHAYRGFWNGIDARAHNFINNDTNLTKYIHKSEAQSGKLVCGN